jgi:hypothetical protein
MIRSCTWSDSEVWMMFDVSTPANQTRRQSGYARFDRRPSPLAARCVALRCVALRSFTANVALLSNTNREAFRACHVLVLAQPTKQKSRQSASVVYHHHNSLGSGIRLLEFAVKAVADYLRLSGAAESAWSSRMSRSTGGLEAGRRRMYVREISDFLCEPGCPSRAWPMFE